MTQSGSLSSSGPISLAINGGTLLQSGSITGGTGVSLIDTGGLLIQTAGGITTALSGPVLLAGPDGLTQQGDVLADAGGATFTAVNGTLEQDGVVTAIGGAATLAARNGELNQTQQVTGNSARLPRWAAAATCRRAAASVHRWLRQPAGRCRSDSDRDRHGASCDASLRPATT